MAFSCPHATIYVLPGSCWYVERGGGGAGGEIPAPSPHIFFFQVVECRVIRGKGVAPDFPLWSPIGGKVQIPPLPAGKAKKQTIFLTRDIGGEGGE